MSGKETLVGQVKAVQRQSPADKEAWWNYCDTHLGGVRDPNRHDEATLSQFLEQFQAAGGTINPNAGAGGGGWGGAGGKGSNGGGGWGGGKGGGGWGGKGWGGAGGGAGGWGDSGSWGAPSPGAAMAAAMVSAIKGGGGGGGGHGSLGDAVKMGQRVSPSWKAAWQKYCALYGGGINDPSKHDDAHIVNFLNFVGDLANVEFDGPGGGAAAALGAGGVKRPFGGASGYPPAKRAAPAWGGGGAADGPKAELVQRVKNYQKSSPDAKQLWWTFCDDLHGGVKDPNRHEATVLEEFLALHEA